MTGKYGTLRSVADTAELHREFLFTDTDFDRLRQLVRRHTGIHLSDEKRELVYGRLARRLRQLGLRDFSQYAAMLVAPDAEELPHFCNAVTTNKTAFFRESHHFRHLAKIVLPELMIRNVRKRRLRIWSAGCSTGEEAYSIAMVVSEVMGHLHDWDLRILATDIDSAVLTEAQTGRYPKERFERLPDEQWRRWFVPSAEGPQYEVRDTIRQTVTFRRLNLMDAFPMRGPFDIIFCRNVLIYFDKDTQRKVVNSLAKMQRADDVLYVGHSESLFNMCDDYHLVGKTTYRKVR